MSQLSVDKQHTVAAEVTSVDVIARLGRQQTRAARKRRTTVTALRVVVLLAVLALWELGSGDPRQPGFVLIDEFYVSQPSDILSALLVWVESDLLWTNVGITMLETVVGFAIGAVGGVAAGFITGINRWVAAVLTPFVTALYSVPRLAIAPLFILWLGLGVESKFAFVATIVFFLVFYNTYSGVQDVDQELIDTLRIMKPGRAHIYRIVIFPSAGTWILAGLRISAPYALVGAVTAEMISSNRGMGFLLIRASGQLNTAGVFAAIVVMMVLSLIVTGFVILLEARLLRWRQ